MNAVLMAALLAVAAPAPEGATEPVPAPVSAVEAVGQCPTAEAVSAAVQAALGSPPDRAAWGAPRVADLGERFDITVLGQTRQYADPGRNCEERARVAAVFITLALNPPAFTTPPAPPRAPPPPSGAATIAARPSAEPPSSSAEHRASLALALRMDGAEATGASSVVAPGAELRVELGRRVFGLSASAGILAPTETRLASVPVREQRFPVGLALTARQPLSAALDGRAAIGVALVPFTLRGEGLATPEPALRLDVGARVAVELALRRPAGGLAPFLDLHAELFPRPYAIEVGPLGELGSTARLWLGASVGVALETAR